MLAAALLAIAAAVAAGPVQPPAPAALKLRLTPPEMLRLAELATTKGDASAAAAIYAALERDPDDAVRAEARFRHAKQLLGEKRNGEAALLLRRLLDEKPDAVVPRLELAHAMQLLGDADAALRELRAAQASGLPPAVARLVDRYSQALRAARPFGASFEFAVAPNSNINRATRSDTLGTIFGDFDIDRDSKAKSGTGVSLRGQAYRRLRLGNGDVSFLARLSGFGDLYRKTQFNDVAADFGAGPELRLGRNQLNFEIGATQRWFGQKQFMRSVRSVATWLRPLGDQTQLRLSGSAALIDNQFNDVQDGKAYWGRVAVERALSPTTGVGINLAVDRQALKDPGYSTTGWRAGLIGWREVGRMTLSGEFELGRLRADDRLVLFPHKRSERYSRLSLGATFRQLQFRGFAPIARFSVERNRSTIEFYDFSRTRSEIGFVRAF